MTERSRLWYRLTLAALPLIAVATTVGVAVLLPEQQVVMRDADSLAWVRSAARTVRLSGAIVVVGFSFVAVTLLSPREASPRRLLMRAAGGGAVGWGIGAALELVALWLVSSPTRGLAGLLAPEFADLATGSVVGISLSLQVVIAAFVAVCALAGRSATLSAAALAAGMLGVAVGVAAGHSAQGLLHGLAHAAIVLHVVAAAVWIGSLAAVAAVLTRVGEPGVLVARYRAVAVACAIWVGISGIAAGALMLDATRLLDTRYGWLLLAKTGAFAAVVWLMWRLRRPQPGEAAPTAPSAPSARSRFVATELLLMAVAVGLAAVLSQSAPVLPDLGPEPSGAQAPPSLATTLGTFVPSVFGVVATIALTTPYLAGVLILRRRGDRWPRRRSASWAGGVVLLAAVTCTGLDVYASTLLSIHMLQHMIVNMVVPILLVLGAPVTLAFRALPPSPRAALLAGTRSPVARVVAHPVWVTTVFVGSLFVVYFTPVFPVLMSDHWGHALMLAHFLLSGFVFFWLVLGIDPDRHRPSGPIRVPLIAASMVGHTVFAVVLVFGTALIGETWFRTLDMQWPLSRADDQALAGGIAWGLGEFVMVGVLAVVVYRWFAAAERATRPRPRIGTDSVGR